MSKENSGKRRRLDTTLIDEDTASTSPYSDLADQGSTSTDEYATLTDKTATSTKEDATSNFATAEQEDEVSVLSLSKNYSFIEINDLLQKNQSVSKLQLMRSFTKTLPSNINDKETFLTTSVDSIKMWLAKEENEFTQRDVVAIIDRIDLLNQDINNKLLAEQSIASILGSLKASKSDFYYDKKNKILQSVINFYKDSLDSSSKEDHQSGGSQRTISDEHFGAMQPPAMQPPATPQSSSLSTPPTQESGADVVAGNTPTVLESSGAGPSRQATLQAPQALQVAAPQSQHSSQH